MKNKFITMSLGSIFVCGLSAVAETTKNDADKRASMKSMASTSTEANLKVEEVLASWPNRPRLGARQMIFKYGLPQEISSEKFVWSQKGGFKRIMVTKEEIPHDFPKPHMDFMEHTIEYNVPIDKTAELIEFDGSSTINRTAGELSARCDLEGHNVLTLNLDNDIVTGKKSVKEARKSFAENIVEDVLGNHPPYLEALQFTPTGVSARFPDVPNLPGSPLRSSQNNVNENDESEKGDAEALATLIALDENEVLASAEVLKRQLKPTVKEYALMLQKAHGKNAVASMKLGGDINVTPIESPTVDELRVKGAGNLAALIPLEGEEFEKTYIVAMISGHKEVLKMIDTELSEKVKNKDLKNHIFETRAHVASHLEQAIAIQKNL